MTMYIYQITNVLITYLIIQQNYWPIEKLKISKSLVFWWGNNYFSTTTKIHTIVNFRASINMMPIFSYHPHIVTFRYEEKKKNIHLKIVIFGFQSSTPKTNIFLGGEFNTNTKWLTNKYDLNSELTKRQVK